MLRYLNACHLCWSVGRDFQTGRTHALKLVSIQQPQGHMSAAGNLAPNLILKVCLFELHAAPLRVVLPRTGVSELCNYGPDRCDANLVQCYMATAGSF